MQNLKLTANSNGDQKFYHYCYVCNTQLNSCKQALLHCSGKRHRKKLQFLQSRKHSVGQIPSGPPIGAPPLPVNPAQNGASDQACFPVFPHVPTLPTLPGPPSQFPGVHEPIPAQLVNPPGPMGPVGAIGGPCPSFYPQPGVLSPATMAGTDQWLHPVPIFSNGPLPLNHGMSTQPSHHQQMHGAIPMAMGPYPNQPNGNLLMGPQYISSSSSPLLLTDVTSGSSYSGGTSRSAVISPSETSSLSSDLSVVSGKSFKCYVCQRHFPNLAQLHCHLQTARHYKQDQPAFLCRGNVLQVTNNERRRDSSETDSGSTSIYYCSACNIAVNSRAQMETHNAGHRHKQRSVAHQRKHSRSSSTSSDPPMEIIVDSGYASGSGEDVVRMLNPNPEKPTAKYRCQICNIYLNSSAQAKQHLNSQKHQLRIGARPPFRRKSNSFRKKYQCGQIVPAAIPVDSSQDTSQENVHSDDFCEKHSHSDGCETPPTPSPEPNEEPETDSTLTVHQTNSL